MNASSALGEISRSRAAAPPTSPVLYMCSARRNISRVSGGPEASAASSAALTSSSRPVSRASKTRAAARDASVATSSAGRASSHVRTVSSWPMLNVRSQCAATSVLLSTSLPEAIA